MSNDSPLTPSVARDRLEQLLQDVERALAPHDNIRSDDSQYEDPEEAWLRPLKRQLQEALHELNLNS